MNLIQSTFGNPTHGNFELVAREGSNLVHYYRDNSNPSGPWSRGRVITDKATGEGWILQSAFGSPPQPNFEVVVQEGSTLVHYYRDNAKPTGAWTRGHQVTDKATGPASFIQGTFGGAHGNFELVVLEGSNLVHYYRDNTKPTGPWTRGRVVTTAATGAGAIMQSDFGGAIQGNFEVVVPEGAKLVHYYRDNRFPTGPWYRATVISQETSGPASIIQGDFGKRPGGNFELVALEGTKLVHYYRDNTTPTSPWVRAQVITDKASGPGSIIQSSFGGTIGNFEVVVPEGNALVHYYHNNTAPNEVWQRGQVVNAAS
jgi:hypothetical protein